MRVIKSSAILPNTLLFNCLKTFTSSNPPSNPPPTNQLSIQNAQSLINKWVTNNKVCLFMKGNPDAPRCGYSRLMVEILNFYGLNKYKHIDIFENPVIRQQVKIYSKWPTYPQLFVDGVFVGGSDVVNEMHHDDSLRVLLVEKGIISQ